MPLNEVGVGVPGGARGASIERACAAVEDGRPLLTPWLAEVAVGDEHPVDGWRRWRRRRWRWPVGRRRRGRRRHRREQASLPNGVGDDEPRTRVVGDGERVAAAEAVDSQVDPLTAARAHVDGERGGRAERGEGDGHVGGAVGVRGVSQREAGVARRQKKGCGGGVCSRACSLRVAEALSVVALHFAAERPVAAEQHRRGRRRHDLLAYLVVVVVARGRHVFADAPVDAVAPVPAETHVVTRTGWVGVALADEPASALPPVHAPHAKPVVDAAVVVRLRRRR